MPIQKNKKVKTSKKKLDAPRKNQNFYDQLKLNESYISLILGAIVVLGASVLFAFFLRESRQSNLSKPPAVLNSSVSPEITKTPTVSQKTYIMQENETLWDVAVREFGDGFRYTDLIEANNFENPDFVPPGTKIIIPSSE